MTSFWRRFSRNAGAVIGLAVLAVVILVALFASLMFSTSPWQMVGPPLLLPFEEQGFALGTDMLGRDIAAGLAHGARVSLLVGVVSTGCAVVIGVAFGTLAGYFGGAVEHALMSVTEFFQTIPQLAMAVVLVAIFTPTLESIVIAIALVSWPPVARLVRAEVLSLREREFVEAAIVLGRPTRAIIFGEILPNAISPVIVAASLIVATAILTEAALSFLGLGVPPPLPSWGLMIAEAKDYMFFSPWVIVIPGVALFVLVLGINLLGDGLRDLFGARTDP